MFRLLRGETILAIVAASVAVFPGVAKADLIPASAYVRGELNNNDSGLPGLFSDGPNVGPTAAASASGSVIDALNGISASGFGNASVSLVPVQDGVSWSLHADADYSMSTNGSSTSYVVRSIASWQDILYLGSTDPNVVGHTLRLTFSSTGMLQQEGAGGQQDTYVYLNANGGAQVSTGTVASAGVEVQFNGSVDTRWDSFTQYSDGSYAGTFHLDIPINPGQGYLGNVPGSVYYQLSDTAEIAGQSEYGISAFASDPIQFLSVTLPDVGNVTPESLGVSLTFASGTVSPNAVPEPGSIVLLVIGMGTVIGHATRRRKPRPCHPTPGPIGSGK